MLFHVSICDYSERAREIERVADGKITHSGHITQARAERGTDRGRSVIAEESDQRQVRIYGVSSGERVAARSKGAYLIDVAIKKRSEL